jgi:hypothetical protein
MGDIEYYLWGSFFCTPHLSILEGEIPYKVTTIEWFNIGLEQWIAFVIQQISYECKKKINNFFENWT